MQTISSDETSNKPHILLAEDYEPNIMVTGHYLDFLGYTYDVARTGLEAFEKFKANSYAAILMDVQMPELDGFDATQLIRQYESSNNLSRIHIIGVTAYALSGDKERCLGAGMDDYISKPVREDELKEKLNILPKLEK